MLGILLEFDFDTFARPFLALRQIMMSEFAILFSGLEGSGTLFLSGLFTLLFDSAARCYIAYFAFSLAATGLVVELEFSGFTLVILFRLILKPLLCKPSRIRLPLLFLGSRS